MEEINRHPIFGGRLAVMEGRQLVGVIGFGREIDLFIIGIAALLDVLEVAEHMSSRAHVP